MKLKINGIEYEAEEGVSVLEVARGNDIWIPTLCYNKHLTSYGACRLCLVEMTRKGRTKVTASCTLGARDEMEIVTESPRLERLRRLNMELILAHSPASEAVCEMADKLGAKAGRLETNDGHDCILCGMCVRACQEISQAQAVSFANRGVERRIVTPFGEFSSNCLLCGACVSVCPTGSRLLDLVKISGQKPQVLMSKFEADLKRSGAIDRPFAQAVPNMPVINRQACLKLNCDACGICEKACKAGAINYDDKDKVREIDIGAVIVVPGFEEFLAGQKYDYGCSRYDDVVSSIQFERILSASGPFSGHVQRLSDGKTPERIAFLQCVGSRDISCRNGYCSSVCCMYAIKEAVIAKEHLKDVDVTVFFMDMRAFGKDFDKYYERAKAEYGVKFIRARVSDINQKNGSDSLVVQYSPQSGCVAQDEFDLVVLSVGLEPMADSSALVKKLGVRLEPNGFIWSEPLNPLRTSKPGVFVGGAVSGPKDIPETVTQASATASEASQLLADVRNTLTTKREFPPEIDVSNLPPRIGVFVCHCGTNIGSVVDVPVTAEYAKSLPYVVYAEDNLYTCSQDAQDHIQELIAKYKLNRVVVASCSPRTHEPLFQQTLREAGLNPHLFEMANIRDQCSWVHKNQAEQATNKAKSLVRMAVAKVAPTEPLQTASLDVTPLALVIGGGLAGMTAALGIADQGFEVTLVERQKQLGGNLRNLRSTFAEPNVQAYLAHLEEHVQKHKNISVYTGTEIESIEGFIGNFQSTLKTGSKERKIEHGAIIVATGGNEYKPDEYLYGRDKRVVTQLELEDLLAPAPATGAGLADKEPLSGVKTAVFIQCVGSREEEHMYCSRVCCSTAVKNALKIKELSPETEVYVLYRDIRTYGFNEQYFQTARDKGVIFVRYEADNKPKVTNKAALKVTVHEPLLGSELVLEPDLLILSSRIDPDSNNEALAQMLKVPVNEDRFFLEAHVKLRPVEFATEGIFVAGLAHSPKSIPETIAQAKATASKACIIISQDKFEGEARIAKVDINRCSACGICTEVCAYKAVEVILVDERLGTKAAFVNPALCKGCGTCCAICRPGAIDVEGISDHQIDLMIKAI